MRLMQLLKDFVLYSVSKSAGFKKKIHASSQQFIIEYFGLLLKSILVVQILRQL